MLCDAIFLLRQLSNLKVVFGKGFADMIKQRSYQEVRLRVGIKRGLESS